MVVDDLQHLGLIDAVHRLAALVVVHQDELLLVQVHQIPAGHHAHIAALVVQHREVPEPDGGHHLGH